MEEKTDEHSLLCVCCEKYFDKNGICEDGICLEVSREGLMCHKCSFLTWVEKREIEMLKSDLIEEVIMEMSEKGGEGKVVHNKEENGR